MSPMTRMAVHGVAFRAVLCTALVAWVGESDKVGGDAMKGGRSLVRSFVIWSAHALIFAVWFLSSTLAPAFAACPNPPPVTISPQLPSDACVADNFPGNPIQFFDDFSWRSFIALMWPVENGVRGVPDTTKNIGPVSGPLVFETFKADWEVFQPSPDGTSPPPAPAPWGSFAGRNPCSFTPPRVIGFMPQGIGGQPLFGLTRAPSIGFGDMVLAAFSNSRIWVKRVLAIW